MAEREDKVATENPFTKFIFEAVVKKALLVFVYI